MKSTLTLCAVLLSGSMFLAAQQPATSPSASTPPTFPTDQKAPASDQQAPVPNQPQSTLPPDKIADQTSTQSSVDKESVAPKTIEGCLSQASAGNGFVLTDASGIGYNLQGDSSLMSSHVGQEVSVTGAVTKTTASSSVSNTDSPDSKNTSAAASDSHSTKSTDSVINVSKLDKVADSCSTSQAPVSK